MIRYGAALFGLCLAASAAPAQHQNPYGATSPSPLTLVPAGNANVMGTLRGADFNSTADQQIAVSPRITAFQITSIIVTACNGNLSNSVGGFYPLAGKSGVPLVSAAQTYSLSPGGGILNVPLLGSAGATKFNIHPIFFSLTTGQGSALLCDIYVLGVDLS
jgi:hypothetical protein